MRVRNVVEQLLPPILVAGIRFVWERTVRRSESISSQDPIPWATGYVQWKHEFIRRILADPDMLGRFRDDQLLPGMYGYDMDERSVEYPWLFANLADDEMLMLDAGSVLNHPFLIEEILRRQQKLHIMTLAPEGQAFWDKGISYLYSDLRDIPIRDN